MILVYGNTSTIQFFVGRSKEIVMDRRRVKYPVSMDSGQLCLTHEPDSYLYDPRIVLTGQLKAGRTALLSFNAMINMLYRDRENRPGRLRRQLSTFSRVDKQTRRMISGTDINIFRSGS